MLPKLEDILFLNQLIVISKEMNYLYLQGRNIYYTHFFAIKRFDIGKKIYLIYMAIVFIILQIPNTELIKQTCKQNNNHINYIYSNLPE